MQSKPALAKLISTLGGPFRTVSSLGIVLIAIKIIFYYENIVNTFFFILSITFFSIFPILYMAVGKLMGFVSDVDLQNLKQRREFFIFTLLCWTIGTLIASIVAQRIVYEGLALVIGIGIITLITPIWKISAHMLLNFILHAIVLVHTIHYYKQFSKIAIIYLLLALFWIALIGWARITGKKHTLKQVLAGGFIGITIGILYIAVAL